MPDFNLLANNPDEFIRQIGAGTPQATPASRLTQAPTPTSSFGTGTFNQLANDPDAYIRDVIEAPRAQRAQALQRQQQEQARADYLTTPGGRLSTAVDNERQRRERTSFALDYFKEDFLGDVVNRLPFVGSIKKAYDLVSVRNAALRIKEDKAQDADYATVARFLAETESKEKRGLIGDIWDTILEVPAMAVEFGLTAGAFTAGRVAATKGLTKIAGKAIEKSALAAVGSSVASYAAGSLAQAAAVPQRVLADAAQRSLPSIDQSQPQPQITDPGGVIGHIPHGLADMAVTIGILGSMSRIANNTPGFIQRNAIRVGAGLAEQQVADVATSLVGLNTGYGVAGDIARGDMGMAMKRSLLQATTFAAFAGLHEGVAAKDKILGAYRRAMDRFRGQGVSAEGAGESLNRVGEVIAEHIAENPDLTRREATEAVQGTGIASGPAREYAQTIIDTLPNSQTEAKSRNGKYTVDELTGQPNAPESPRLPQAQGTPTPPAGATEAPVAAGQAPNAGAGQVLGVPEPSPRPVTPPEVIKEAVSALRAMGVKAKEAETRVQQAVEASDRAFTDPTELIKAALPAKPGQVRGPDATAQERLTQGVPPEAPPVAPPAPEPPRPEPMPAVESRTFADLWQRSQQGEPVSRADLVQAAGWSEREAKIVFDRIAGRTQAEIGTELGVTRQAIQKAEKNALAKTGMADSITEAILKSEKAARASELQQGQVDLDGQTEGERTRAVPAWERAEVDMPKKAKDLAAMQKQIAKELLDAHNKGESLERIISSKLAVEMEVAQRQGRSPEKAMIDALKEIEALKEQIHAEPEQASATSGTGRPLDQDQGNAGGPGATPGVQAALQQIRTQGNPLQTQPVSGQVAEPATPGVSPAPSAASETRVGPEAQAGGSEASASQGSTAQAALMAKIEPMPPVETREQGGTFGGGALIQTGSNKLAAAKNEAVEANRDGLAKIEKMAGHEYKQDWEAARAAVAADPKLSSRLAQEVVASPGDRALTRVETAVLVHRHISIRNEAQALIDKLTKGAMEMSDRTINKLNNEIADLKIETDLIDRALSVGGSVGGGAQGIRRAMVKFDYSYLGLIDQAQAANPKKPLTEAEKAKIREMSTRIKELQDQLDAAEARLTAEGHGSQGEAYGPWVKVDINTKIAQGETARFTQSRRWEAMSTGEKALDWFKRIRIAELISSPITAGKVGMSSLLQMVSSPTQEIITSGLRMVPGIKVVAEKAPIEGSGFRGTTELAAAKEGWTTGMKDAWETLKNGESDLDIRFGKSYDIGRPYSWIDFIGNLHGAEKAPAVRAAYERAFQHVEASEKAKGKDVTSPAALERIGQQAYERAIAERFQQDNAAVDVFNRAVSTLKRSESSGANALGHTLEIALPIVRTPTNIIISAFEHVLGVPLGLGRVAVQHARGIEGLTQPQAEGIMRQLKKGTLGIPLMMLGYYLADSVGGFYSGKRKENDVEAGAINTPFGRVPGWAAAHHPALMALQFGASVRRAADQIKKGEQQGLAAGALHGFGALLEEVPFVREQAEIAHLDRGVGPLARSFVIPQLIQWLAKQTDNRDALGRPVQHHPQGFMDQLRLGVPGLRAGVP